MFPHDWYELEGAGDSPDRRTTPELSESWRSFLGEMGVDPASVVAIPPDVVDTGEETPVERAEHVDVPRRPGEAIGEGEPAAAASRPGFAGRGLDALVNFYNNHSTTRNIALGTGGFLAAGNAYVALAALNPAVAAVAGAAVAAVGGAKFAYDRFRARATAAPSDGGIDVVVSAGDVDAVDGGAVPHPARREGFLRRAAGYVRSRKGAAIGGAAGLAAFYAAGSIAAGSIAIVPALAAGYFAYTFGDRAVRAAESRVNAVKNYIATHHPTKAQVLGLLAGSFIAPWAVSEGLNWLVSAADYNLERVATAIAAPIAANILANMAVNRYVGEGKSLGNNFVRWVADNVAIPAATGAWFGNVVGAETSVLYNYGVTFISGIAGAFNSVFPNAGWGAATWVGTSIFEEAVRFVTRKSYRGVLRAASGLTTTAGAIEDARAAYRTGFERTRESLHRGPRTPGGTSPPTAGGGG